MCLNFSLKGHKMNPSKIESTKYLPKWNHCPEYETDLLKPELSCK